MEQVEAAQEDGVVLPSRIKQTREERRKARAKGAPALGVTISISCRLGPGSAKAPREPTRNPAQPRDAMHTICNPWLGGRVSGVVQTAVCASAADDTELLPDNEVTAAEEALEKPEDDGIQLEPFNLAQVRALCCRTAPTDEPGNT